MDRQIIYVGAIPLSIDQLKQSRNAMTSVGALAAAAFGSGTLVDGLACAPTAPASMQVQVAPGSIYSLQNVDDVAYGALAADTTHQTIKQGIVLSSTLLSCPAPGTGGFSINYLVQAAFSETDTDATLLAYYNAANPASPFAGAANDGLQDNTRRQAACVVSVKAGIAATTGTQTTPAPDSGKVGLFVVTVANGQTSITASSISQVAGAPFIGTKLPDVPSGVRDGTWVYADDFGAANAYQITPTPAAAAYVKGQGFRFKALNSNTTASTLAVSGLATRSIVRQDGSALGAGDIVAAGIYEVVYDGAKFRLLSATGSVANVYSTSGTSGASTTSTSYSSTGFSIAVSKKRPANKVVWMALVLESSDSSGSPHGILGEARFAVDQGSGFNALGLGNIAGGNAGSIGLGIKVGLALLAIDDGSLAQNYTIRAEYASQDGATVNLSGVTIVGIELWQ